MVKLFKRKHKLSREQEIANAINNCVTSIIERYKNTPVKVEHNIKRNIPRPTTVIVWAESATGQRYHLGWMDLSYKDTAPITINPGMIYEEYLGLPPIQLRLELQYDPRDRRG